MKWRKFIGGESGEHEFNKTLSRMDSHSILVDFTYSAFASESEDFLIW